MLSMIDNEAEACGDRYLLPKIEYKSIYLDDYYNDKNPSNTTQILAQKYLHTTIANNDDEQVSLFSKDTLYGKEICDSSSRQLRVFPSFVLPPEELQVNERPASSTAIADMHFARRYGGYNDNACGTVATTTNAAVSSSSGDSDYSDKVFKYDQHAAGKGSRGGPIYNSQQQRVCSDNYNEDDNGDIWLFGKPNANNNNNHNNNNNANSCSAPRPTENTTAGRVPAISSQSKETATTTTRRRSERDSCPPKDFSDQDEEDDKDVTSVLDIQRLKMLPKLF